MRSACLLLRRPNGPAVYLARPIGPGWQPILNFLRPEGPVVQLFPSAHTFEEPPAFQASRGDEGGLFPRPMAWAK